MYLDSVHRFTDPAYTDLTLLLRAGRDAAHLFDRLVLREEVYTDGKFEGLKPKAEVFLTAYTLDDADAAERPVTFAFNGGPGSSSIWLRMAATANRASAAEQSSSALTPSTDE